MAPPLPRLNSSHAAYFADDPTVVHVLILSQETANFALKAYIVYHLKMKFPRIKV